MMKAPTWASKSRPGFGQRSNPDFAGTSRAHFKMDPMGFQYFILKRAKSRPDRWPRPGLDFDARVGAFK